MTLISVITVTHNRLGLMRRKLESMLSQSLNPELFEWIVCINGCTDETLQVFQALNLPFCLKLIVHNQQQSPSVARNACAKGAKGRTLYLSDDDCSLAPDTLEQHLKRQQQQACVAIGGISFESEEGVEHWRPRRVNYWNLNGANTSLPREAFEAVGGFETSLEGYGGEDLLLGYALKAQNVPFVALPQVSVRHLGVNPMHGQDAAKARSAGRNAVRIARQHPELAFRLGVNKSLLALKRLLLNPPLAWVWQRLGGRSYQYERHYLAGALEEINHV